MTVEARYPLTTTPIKLGPVEIRNEFIFPRTASDTTLGTSHQTSLRRTTLPVPPEAVDFSFTPCRLCRSQGGDWMTPTSSRHHRAVSRRRRRRSPK